MQNVSTREFKQLLMSSGYLYARMKGSHATYRHYESGKTITIPVSSKEINGCIVKRLKKENLL